MTPSRELSVTELSRSIPQSSPWRGQGTNDTANPSAADRRRAGNRSQRVTPIALAVALLATPAIAQPVDYDAMEQLFGEPITTSVTGKPQRVTDAPANIEIITQDDIRRSGATTIPDVLAFVTGLDVHTTGLGVQDVGIRGYNQANNPHLMVLINGRQVYMVDYGRVVWNALPVQLNEIRQIEVIKGPNSALYGFNAVGGVINIITYDPLKESVNTASFVGGTQNYLSGSVVSTMKFGETAGVRLSAGGFSATNFAPGPITPSDAATRERPFAGNLAVDARWQITPKVQVYFDGSYGTNRMSHPSPQAYYDTENMHSWSARLGVNAETPIGLLDVSLYRNQVGDNGMALIPLPPFTYTAHEQQSVTVLQASDLLKLGTNHTIRIGLEIRRNQDVSSDTIGGTLADTIFAGSLMWDWQITPTIALTNAVRFDHAQLSFSGSPSVAGGLTSSSYNSVTIDQPSVNSGVVWKATNLDTFRFTVARGVQLPTLIEQGLRIDPNTAGPVGYYGTPGLRPSIVWNVELDYDRSLTSIGSVLRTSLFAQRTDDIIAPPFSRPPSFVPPSYIIGRSSNVGYSTAAGAEIGIKGHSASGWRWNLSYALAVTTNHTVLNQNGLNLSAQLYSRSTPAHVVVAGIGYSQGKWEADVMARWQSSFQDTRGPLLPGPVTVVNVDNYITFNARVAYKVWDHVTLSLVAQQLNAPRLVTSAEEPQERRILAGLTVRF